MTAVVREQLVDAARLRDLAKDLHGEEWRLGSVVASAAPGDEHAVDLRYCFYATRDPGWRVLLVRSAVGESVPSLTPVVIAADWFEREIEDLFSVRFAQHPRLGDFVLHDDMWAEEVGIMRRSAEPASAEEKREARPWRPKRVLEEEGAFVMPVGPIFSGEAESALFLLETVGEDVVRAMPRLFYKYRAIEKLAEGKSVHDALLYVERCNGTSAVGNGWAYCRAVEGAAGIEIPQRARVLRGLFAELERIRHHASAIREICSSTSLVVAASQLLWIEEQLLRVCGELSGHRYLFGVLAIGGLLRDLEDAAVARATERCERLMNDLRSAVDTLADSSSFLDRIERVGIIPERHARTFELVGPLARASGVRADMRTVQPYDPYPSVRFEIPAEDEGDGFARMRLLFRETQQSVAILRALSEELAPGEIRAPYVPRAGSSLGWTEAPRGASIAWASVRNDGTIERLRLTPPSFRNWHGFHLAAEGFAFQDFPIVLATLDLSVAENDR
jgi:formate hydrogenlyase subunit 5